MKEVSEMTFEESLSELESIVKKIDSGAETLESSVKNFERGVLLRNNCQKHLEDAKLRIEKIVKNSSGEIGTEPVEL